VLLACAAAVLPAQAQQGRRLLTIVPSVAVDSTATDNRELSAQNPQSDVVTRISPSLRVDLRGGRTQGSFDYSLTEVFYARRAELNETRNRLAARGRTELIDNQLFVDARADISRQTISAFGTQETANNVVANNNATDVGSAAVSSSLKGRIVGGVSYDAFVSRSIARAKGTSAGDLTSGSASARLSGGTPLLGWSVEGGRDEIDYRLSRRTTTDRAVVGLNSAPDYEVRLGARIGREGSDVTSTEREWRNRYGLSAAWYPTDRTTISLDADKRYFGKSHTFLFQHRMARSVWRFSDTRDVTTSSQPRARTLYDLYDEQLRASVPDPVQRDLLVRALLNGADPRTTVPGGFLESAVTLQRRRDLGVVVSGLRTTLSLQAFSTESSRLDTTGAAPGADDLSRAGQVRQRGLTAAVSHRLTPESSLSLSGSLMRTPGVEAIAGTDMKSVNLAWSYRLGHRGAVSLGGRHVESEGAAPYNESSLVTTLSVQF
jgi:uncharacterized protein (PEP-CTERM system associated)